MYNIITPTAEIILSLRRLGDCDPGARLGALKKGRGFLKANLLNAIQMP
jgi:hypothetical protein